MRHIYHPPNKDELPERAVSRGTGTLEISHSLAGVYLCGTQLGYLLTPELALRISADMQRLALRCLENRRGIY